MRCLLLAISMAFTAISTAQDKAFLSGTCSINSQKYDAEDADNDEKLVYGRFGPAVGFHLSATNIVGFSLNYQTINYEYTTGGFSGPAAVVERETLFEVAPFFRHMKSVGDKCSIYGQFAVGIGAGKETLKVDGQDDEEVKLNTLRFTISPGVWYVLADRWAVSADWGVLGFTSRKETEEVGNDEVVVTISGVEATLSPSTLSFALNFLF